VVPAVIVRSPHAHAHARLASVAAPAEREVWHIGMPATPSGCGTPFVQLPQEECEGAEHSRGFAARDQRPAF